MGDLSLVVVHRANTPAGAEVVKGVLDGAGIEAIIPAESTPLPLSVRLGVAGCEVLVAKENEAKALAALEEARAIGSLEGDIEEGDAEYEAELETETE